MGRKLDTSNPVCAPSYPYNLTFLLGHFPKSFEEDISLVF